MMKNKIILIALLGVNGYAQSVFVNQGEMGVAPNTLVSAHFQFNNTPTGKVINNGKFHFYRDYHNDGIFSFNDVLVPQGTPSVFYQGRSETNLTPNIQDITGSAESHFYNVVFDKQGRDRSFVVENQLVVAHEAEMVDGIVFMNHPAGGTFKFLKGADHSLTSDYSHVHGQVIKEGDEAFKYPIGKGGYYRYAGISAPNNPSFNYLGEYFLQNSDPAHPHNQKQTEIGFINNREYWTIDQGASTSGSVLVTLSWDERTTPYELYNNARAMRIVRWDTAQNKWVDEGGVVDLASKSITTPVDVKGFGVFTMAVLREFTDDDLVIYNGITTNTDGDNDSLIIENVESFPDNNIKIFNRWGVLVYEQKGYGQTGKIFDGLSQGRLTIEPNKKLPTGTYFYIFEYRNKQGETRKKQGWLYLKTDF